MVPSLPSPFSSAGKGNLSCHNLAGFNCFISCAKNSPVQYLHIFLLISIYSNQSNAGDPEGTCLLNVHFRLVVKGNVERDKYT